MLFLPDRDTHPGMPEGEVPVLVNDEPHVARFAKVAVNVVRREGDQANRLGDVLRGWFGPEAGQPGRGERVVFRREEAGFVLTPIR